ncbi:hypothetical protein HC891_07855 [Candidatus Gracilibacteria bacterium]|nr:hypothetical protein [Candidatus Gracilibacteria bacterium]
MAMVDTLDSLIARALFVRPQPAGLPITPDDTRPADRAFGASLVFSALRCILQYIVLPIVLPLVGLAGDFSIGVVMLLDLVALTAIVYSMRRLWQLNHPQRWSFLPMALAIVVLILVMLGYDIWALLR